MQSTYTIRNLINSAKYVTLWANKFIFTSLPSTHTSTTPERKKVDLLNVVIIYPPKIILNCVFNVMRERVGWNKSNTKPNTREIICGAGTTWQPFSSLVVYPIAVRRLLRMIQNFPFFSQPRVEEREFVSVFLPFSLKQLIEKFSLKLTKPDN